MVITFLGAAGGIVTGSKHLLTFESGSRILLDCGLFQGGNADSLNRELLFDPASIDFIILSHAHLDHSGLIPFAVKNGFKGKIICSPPTLQLVEILLQDSTKIMENETRLGERESLFNEYDVKQALTLFVTINYNDILQITEDISVTFLDAGHILGSAVTHIRFREKNRTRSLCFTGDLGRFSNRILNRPECPSEAEIIITESTYGKKLHQSIETTEQSLQKIIQEICVNKQGTLLIPAFSIGRTQELIFSLNKLAESGKLPAVPVFVDSPMAVYATDIVKHNSGYFNPAMKEFIEQDDADPFGFPELKYITKHEDSQKLLALDIPAIIISASGMMDAGRILYHLKKHLPDPLSAVLVTGYCAPGTLGHSIIRGEKKVEILNEQVEVNSEIFSLNEYSAHGDYGDILQFLGHLDKDILKQVFLVHGEKSSMRALKRKLQKEGYPKVEIADFRISYEV